MKTDEQDLVAMEDEAIRQGRVVKSIPEPGMVLIVPSPDFEAGWLAARANPPRVEGVVADPKLFKFWGTDDCKSCETGRITLFVAKEKCMSCDPDSYRPTPQPAPDERKGVSLSEQVKKLEQENQKLSSSLRQINATLMVNFGPDGREKQILDGNEDEHEAMFKVLRSYARTQVPAEPTPDESSLEVALHNSFVRAVEKSPGSMMDVIDLCVEAALPIIRKHMKKAPTEPTREQVRDLVGAMRSLINEASGLLHAHEAALSMDGGNTNMACLQKRIDEARILIAPFAEKGGS